MEWKGLEAFINKETFFEAIINEMLTSDMRYYQAEEDDMIEFLMEDGAEPQVIEVCQRLILDLHELCRHHFQKDVCHWVNDNGFINKYWLHQVLIDDHDTAAMLVFEYEDNPQLELF